MLKDPSRIKMCPHGRERLALNSLLFGRAQANAGRRRFLHCTGLTDMWRRKRQRNSEYSSLGRSAFDHDLTGVVLNDLLHLGQPQSSTVLLPKADEGPKECIPDRFRNTTAIIAHTNLYCRTGVMQLNLNLPHAIGH